MKLVIVTILNLFLLVSCINIKSDYPSIEYFRLKQLETTDANLGTIDGTMQIRDFSIGDELETDYILALWDQTKIQRYYYYRWVSDVSGLITDYFITRYNQQNAFSGGVVRSGSILQPDFIMEGQILDMMAYNSESEDPGANYVNISIRITLLKRDPMQVERKLLLSKVYNSSVPRKNYYVASIPMAYSQALAQIADQVITDIHQAVAVFNKDKSKEAQDLNNSIKPNNK